MSSDLVEDDASRDQASEEKAAVKKTTTSCQGRKCVPGIVYLGHIPPRLRPKHLRNMLSVYGEIGRIFLQPEGTNTQMTHTCSCTQTWTHMSTCSHTSISWYQAHSLSKTPQSCIFEQQWKIKDDETMGRIFTHRWSREAVKTRT